MALTPTEFNFYALALRSGLIPKGMHILELGESQLIPDDAGGQFLAALADLVDQNALREARARLAVATVSRSRYQRAFGPARAVYHAIFRPASYTAIDLDQGPRRYCLDLNGPVNLGIRFDCVINNGTSEHLFDQANVYRTIHEHTRPGGLMLHFTPSLGWVNHGLYNVQPGFFFDLAHANGYEVKRVGLAADGRTCCFLEAPSELDETLHAYPQLRANAELCVLLRKTTDQPFRYPLQGAYAHSAPALTFAQVPRRAVVQARRNLALRRPSLQSSTSEWSWHDDPAIDAAGGNNGDVTGYYGFCTEREAEPWWMVDLGGPEKIAEVVIYNRLDDEAAARWAAHLCVLLSDDAVAWRKVYSRSEDAPFGGADGNPLRVELDGLSARYLRIMLPETATLNLDEIEVY